MIYWTIFKADQVRPDQYFVRGQIGLNYWEYPICTQHKLIYLYNKEFNILSDNFTDKTYQLSSDVTFEKIS